MSDIQLYTQITALPQNLKKEVEDFVAFLQSKTPSTKQVKERTYGYAKDFFTMSEDFDEPLEDFKEYME